MICRVWYLNATLHVQRFYRVYAVCVASTCRAHAGPHVERAAQQQARYRASLLAVIIGVNVNVNVNNLLAISI